ncbi:Cytochrome P450 2C30 [Pyrenophora tritici-repentis]|nr:Cytochrome P450 2C30 [Pyrenophora tritici-repentis]
MTSFGWGQRQCLGMSITRDETVTGCGALMWLFNLRRKIDPVSGKEIEVPLNKSNSLLIIKPDPWEMAFHPRSESRKQQALALWKEAEDKEKEERSEFLRDSAVKRGLVQP